MWAKPMVDVKWRFSHGRSHYVKEIILASQVSSLNLSHLFLEARNLCLQSRSSKYSQPESRFLSASEPAQKCLCAYYCRNHLLTVFQLIWIYTYRKTAMGEPFWRHNEELVILRYMLSQLSLPSQYPYVIPSGRWMTPYSVLSW